MEGGAKLDRGREHYRDQAWSHAFKCLTAADRTDSLGAEDLEMLATTAYMLGRDSDYVANLRRAHDAYQDRGDGRQAIRCAFWIGHSFLFRGKAARGTGWFERAKRLLETVPEDCVEVGYLLVPEWLREMSRRNYEAAIRLTAEAARIGERFDDADLVWLARDDHAKALILHGELEEGLRLVDETLVAATMGELSPIVTGIVYCNTISYCAAVYELRHVREWTNALSTWCEQQPEMIAHNGLCLVHRAEVRLLEGDWSTALMDARRVTERYTRGVLNQIACGRAHYCQGEANRLLGDYKAAEEAFRRASRNGYEPQPGLALMRLAQGKTEAAAAAIRRIVAETRSEYRRAKLLEAQVDIMLACREPDRAHAAARELNEIAERNECEVLRAMAACCRGTTALANGQASDALVELRPALKVWTDLAAQLEIARVRRLIAEACELLGDRDTAALENEAAERIFEELGADRTFIGGERTSGDPDVAGDHGLTPRQLEVLRLVAAGKTNREIATELFVSEHTIARHVQNIFSRLDVSSRTAATAYAFANDLV